MEHTTKPSVERKGIGGTLEESKASRNLITQQKNAFYKTKLSLLKEEVTNEDAKNLDILSEKGSSSWLTALPLREFVLNKQGFVDAIRL